jgi:hypothetical protein
MNAHLIAIKSPFDLQHTFTIITMFKVQATCLLEGAMKLLFLIICVNEVGSLNGIEMSMLSIISLQQALGNDLIGNSEQ